MCFVVHSITLCCTPSTNSADPVRVHKEHTYSAYTCVEFESGDRCTEHTFGGWFEWVGCDGWSSNWIVRQNRLGSECDIQMFEMRKFRVPMPQHYHNNINSQNLNFTNIFAVVSSIAMSKFEYSLFSEKKNLLHSCWAH